MADCVFIDGGSGGSGATTVSFYLGAALAALGERTLVVDGDCECASELYLSGENVHGVYTLADAENGACRVKQVLLPHPKIANLYFLPTLGCANQAFIVSAVNTLAETFDRVLCDKTAAAVCGRAALVCEGYSQNIAKAKAAAAKLKDRKFADVGVILNKVNGGLVYEGAAPTPKDFAAHLGCELYGVIPEDFLLPLGSIKKRTKRAFELCALKLTGRGEKVFKTAKPYRGFKGYVNRILRYFL